MNIELLTENGIEKHILKNANNFLAIILDDGSIDQNSVLIRASEHSRFEAQRGVDAYPDQNAIYPSAATETPGGGHAELVTGKNVLRTAMTVLLSEGTVKMRQLS